MKMKLAASNIAWLPEQDAEAASLLRRTGFEAIEVALTREWPDLVNVPLADVRALAARWRNDGLPIVAAQALLYGRPDLLVLGAPELRQQTRDYLRHVFDRCAAAGATRMVFGSPRNRRREGRSREEAMAIAADVFGALGADAAARGLVLAIEPNPAEYGGDLILTVDDAVELVQAIDHPAVRLNLDHGCMTMAGERIDDAVAAAAGFVVHAHASAPNLEPVDAAVVSLPAFVTVLDRSGYDGWVSLEMRRSETGDLSAFERSIAYVRACAVR